MNKLTTEQLLFAHQIGATYFTVNHRIPKKIYNGNWFYYEEGWYASHITNSANEESCEPIDFTPLYNQWIDHDGGECPVRKLDVVEVIFNDRQDSFTYAADGVQWQNVVKFKLVNAKGKPEDWPEQRADAIGQNGNDGEHYSEAPETEHTTAHHKRPDGTDLIDDWWDTYPPEVARVLMWEQVRKYMNRLGKKDPVHIEVAKMADYMRRWDKKERELAGVYDKPNTIV